MKIFVAILALVACVCAEEWTVKNSEQLKVIRHECLSEHPLTPEQMNKMKNFDFPNEEPVRQYLLCTAVKMGIFCSHQGYHADRIAKQFKMDMDEEEVKKLAEDCIAKYPKGDKANDVAAFEVHGCLMSSVIGDKVKNYIKQRHEAAQQQQA
ncbi:uncharacterized protein LOC119612170 [Lucilia sericata]|uniref:uncharacterized protein LOC119612170 n=1 Tax=Lucilia sericata TaxID=13632 RepID=UPI0018A822EC|nr:uncharacterized protein LOC119612170 [Lucilia sericata]